VQIEIFDSFDIFIVANLAIRQKMEYTLCIGKDYSLPIPMYQPNEGLKLVPRSYMKCSQTCLNISEFGLDL